MVVGFLLMLIGPCAYQSNEGFGDAPGSLADSLRWRRVTYVLMPAGVALTLAAGVSLVIVDRRNPDRNRKQTEKQNDTDFSDQFH